ncbi:MAG: lipoprotein-releasing ABC transporter permease subunit [Desulfuromonas sp.]|nr:lipoprotein-releasing ABC transporter permease subunit [Desulfuromonas sp.]
MRYEWLIGLRYLKAKRKQTFISVISFISVAGVALGVAALILVLAIMTGFHDGVRQQILGNVAHVMVQSRDAGMPNWEQVVRKIQTVSPAVKQAEPFVSKEVMLLAGANVAPANIKGVRSSNRIMRLEYDTGPSNPPANVQEALFDASSRNQVTPGIVIASDTAATLGVVVGDKIQVIPPDFSLTPFGIVPKIRPFEVVAISRSKGGFLDAYYAYITLEQAQGFVGEKDRVSGIEVELEHFDQAAAVALQLREAFRYPYSVRSWEDMFGSFLAALKLEKLGLFIILGIIVVVAAFNIGTTLIMVVMDKHKDIAILRSMGATASSIMRIFMIQGLIIGIAGTVAGSALGLTLALNADAVITWVERKLGVTIFDTAVYGMDHFPSQVVAADVITVIVTAFIICLLATVYPARRAACSDPAESLRYE